MRSLTPFVIEDNTIIESETWRKNNVMRALVAAESASKCALF